MSSAEAQPTPEEPAGPARRRLLWAAGAVSLLLLLSLTPPLMNVNRLRRRIATSMSASIGRPVHLDGVSLHLLPIPGFTLQNLVVSEDPAFGDEPVIRAMKVEVTLRPSSLWRRQVEISTIRFEVDDNGSAPNLNLVRNAQGQWNLQSLLMHAAEVDTAPTAQSTPGPTPRFPYIEATGGRVNIKLGEEKQPFSLTDADFALWLPKPEQWRVRLEGKPMRTDTNAADTGTVRLEGQLQRAATMGEVPVDLRASWYNAPMGEASKLLMGVDAGWRGTLLVDATLLGPLSAARLTTTVHVNDLRRADFVPARSLDLSAECSGQLDVQSAVVTSPSCSLPTPVPAGGKQPGQVAAVADRVDLAALHSRGFGMTGVRLGMTNVPDGWLLDWARLFSRRIPAGESPQGAVGGTVLFERGDERMPPSLQGSAHGEVKGLLPWQKQDADAGMHPVELSFEHRGVLLAPIAITSSEAPLTLSGEATPAGYSLHLAGTATAAQLNTLRGLLPPLGDGMDTALPELTDGGSKPLKVNLTCTRAWGAEQTCTAAAEPAKPARRRR